MISSQPYVCRACREAMPNVNWNFPCPHGALGPFEMLKVVGNGFERVRKYPRFLAWLLRFLQRRCQHHTMKADILEGSAGVYAVRWCETCGAIWVVIDGTPCGNPRLCEPTWEK